MTGKIEQKLREKGLELPAPMQVPPGLILPFSWCKVIGNRVTLSGHLPLSSDGSLWPVTGKVGKDVDIEQAYAAAQQATLGMLATLQRELGSLDRIDNWVKIFGMVNTATGFHQTAPVINGCSDLLIDLFGDRIGSHTRSAVGFAELPFNCPVEIEGELTIAGETK
jgi:enamine deaminase RidA (YjgF/YER057c/UK114 family)